MPIRNAIIAQVVRINPPVSKRGVEMLREASPDGFSIEFEGKQVARLLPDEKAAGILEILEELRKMGAPVYVDVHPDSKAIIRLLIPLVGKVAGISEVKGDEIHVAIEISSTRHVLIRSNPDFDEILKTLRSARENKTLMIVTETDNHEIIDVRPFTAEFKPPTPPPLPRPLPTPPKKIFRLRWPFLFVSSITEHQAEDMFTMVNSTTCDPLAVPPPCIPFLYPDGGCWGRAHEMYRLMLNEGVVSKKVWLFGNLNVQTKNNPLCHVFWGWHVAPTVCVRGSGRLGWLFITEKVIDPSLFDGLVSRSTWKNIQGDPNAELVDTDGSVFYHSSDGIDETDPTYIKTAQVLATYRLLLKNRSLQFGPPPYANCP
jgi:hypothetical protein